MFRNLYSNITSVLSSLSDNHRGSDSAPLSGDTTSRSGRGSNRFSAGRMYVRHRVRMSAGKGREVDVLGAGGGDQWVCQSKWVKTKKVNRQAVDAFLQQAEWAREDTDAITVTPWMFAYVGLTAEAEAYARSKGVLWSDIHDFNSLLGHLGLRTLPEL